VPTSLNQQKRAIVGKWFEKGASKDYDSHSRFYKNGDIQMIQGNGDAKKGTYEVIEEGAFKLDIEDARGGNKVNFNIDFAFKHKDTIILFNVNSRDVILSRVK